MNAQAASARASVGAATAAVPAAWDFSSSRVGGDGAVRPTIRATEYVAGCALAANAMRGAPLGGQPEHSTGAHSWCSKLHSGVSRPRDGGRVFLIAPSGVVLSYNMGRRVGE
jgi:hypothetical protein